MSRQKYLNKKRLVSFILFLERRCQPPSWSASKQILNYCTKGLRPLQSPANISWGSMWNFRSH